MHAASLLAHFSILVHLTYLQVWEGWSTADNSWEPDDNISDDLMEDYMARMAEQEQEDEDQEAEAEAEVEVEGEEPARMEVDAGGSVPVDAN